MSQYLLQIVAGESVLALVGAPARVRAGPAQGLVTASRGTQQHQLEAIVPAQPPADAQRHTGRLRSLPRTYAAGQRTTFGDRQSAIPKLYCPPHTPRTARRAPLATESRNAM